MVLLVPVRRAWLLAAALAFPACGSEAEPEAPPLVLLAPQLRTPMSSAYVGSVHAATSLSPTFSWAPTDDAAPASSYELQISTDRTFARSLISLTTADTRAKPMFELPVSRQVPVGARYYWRVRACDDAACSEFSSARTLNLGRSDHDVNGDGFADVLVGSPTYGGESLARAYVYLGGAGAAFDGEPDGTLVAPVAKDQFGTQVTSAGDFNDDGFADVIVGAPGAADQAGAAYVYFGGPGARFDPTPDLALHGDSPEDRFGSAISGAGDLNSDGFADLAIGAPGAAGDLGAVYIYLGGRDGTLTTRSLPGLRGSQFFGLDVAAAGDIDSDGYADLAVVVNGSSPLGTYVFFGDATGALEVSKAVPGFFPIAGDSDVNGDGFADLLVHTFGDGSSATAKLYVGGPDRLDLGTLAATYSEPDPGFGSSMALPGDVDGDGFDDILFGAGQQYQGSVGGAYLYAGGPKSEFGTIAYSKIVGPRERFSEWLVASPGDVNGDGSADLVIGSVFFDASASGSVLIYAGGSRQALDAPPYGTLRDVDPTGQYGRAVGVRAPDAPR